MRSTAIPWSNRKSSAICSMLQPSLGAFGPLAMPFRQVQETRQRDLLNKNFCPSVSNVLSFAVSAPERVFWREVLAPVAGFFRMADRNVLRPRRSTALPALGRESEASEARRAIV